MISLYSHGSATEVEVLIEARSELGPSAAGAPQGPLRHRRARECGGVPAQRGAEREGAGEGAGEREEGRDKSDHPGQQRLHAEPHAQRIETACTNWRRVPFPSMLQPMGQATLAGDLYIL